MGLAAGFDKNAEIVTSIRRLGGFGFTEIGTVTPRPQAGNPKKRIFRLTKDDALINRLGFNNDGVDAVVKRLKIKNLNFTTRAYLSEQILEKINQHLISST